MNAIVCNLEMHSVHGAQDSEKCSESGLAINSSPEPHRRPLLGDYDHYTEREGHTCTTKTELIKRELQFSVL